jgi:hypothetical protein
MGHHPLLSRWYTACAGVGVQQQQQQRGLLLRLMTFLLFQIVE